MIGDPYRVKKYWKKVVKNGEKRLGKQIRGCIFTLEGTMWGGRVSL
jgi:hypothetical protein